MAAFSNREIMDQVVPALRAVGSFKLQPASNLLILQLRQAFEPQAAILNEVRNKALMNRAILNDGQPVTKGNVVVFAEDPVENMMRQAAFNADMTEVLEQTFECDMTIDYEKHLSKVSIPANVLFDLGELLILPKDEEPEESGEATEES